jgi:hypothetical protein
LIGRDRAEQVREAVGEEDLAVPGWPLAEDGGVSAGVGIRRKRFLHPDSWAAWRRSKRKFAVCAGNGTKPKTRIREVHAG